ncbi:hypothetical protein [Halonatronum saccharophilum]|uniref:hypothetical protein n=1 Tax=Halonatronum saccharophilum TaxID=150060 RepID=UPI000484891A|nr:hypothetical protein [Halonatronum saccharophilum]
MIRMRALSTFKGAEGFVVRGSEFETSERRAKVLKRRKLAEEVVGPEEDKSVGPGEMKGDNEEVDDSKELLDGKKFKVADLEEVAKLLEMSGVSGLNKDELIKLVSEELSDMGFDNLGQVTKEEVVEGIRDRG